MKILEDLWYGQICPIGQTDRQDENYRDLAALYTRSENKLLPMLTQEQLEALEKLLDTREELNRITECAAFATGFRLAVQLMTASL